MAIQHIDMAVPVGSAADEKRAGERAEAELAELEAMQARLRSLVRSTCGLNWRPGTRARHQQQFGIEIRALIKKFASSQAADINERNDRASVRARLYTELLALARDLEEDVGLRQALFMTRLTRVLAGAAVLIVALAAALAIILSLQ